MKIYSAIQKIDEQDDGTIRIHGIASTEDVDSVGEIIRADAMRAAKNEYMKFPALREMHGLSAAGTTLEIDVGDDNVTRIIGLVVDPVAISKCLTGTYRGLSIGGRVTKRDPSDRKIITGIELKEISLVDRPANSACSVSLMKLGGVDLTDDQIESAEDSLPDPTTDSPEADSAEPPRRAAATGDDPMSKIKKAPDTTDVLEKTIEPAPLNPSKIGDVMGDTGVGGAATGINQPVAGKHVSVTLPGNSAGTAVKVPNPEEAGQATPKPLDETEVPPVEGAAPAAAAPGTDQRTRKDAADESTPVTEEVVEDPLTLARAAADNALKAATAVLNRLSKQTNGVSPVLAPGLELRKGLHATGRVGCLLVELAYCLADAQFEKAMEGDDSQVPAKLHSALESLGAAYKAMSDEELQELLDGADQTMSAQIALAAASGDLVKAFDGVLDADALAKVAGTTDHDALIKTQAQNGELLKITGALTATLDGVTAEMAKMADKIASLEDAPMPPKTVTKAADPAILTAVGKEQDGQPRIDDLFKGVSGSLSEDEVRAALEAMPKEERDMAIMKASLNRINARVIQR